MKQIAENAKTYGASPRPSYAMSVLLEAFYASGFRGRSGANLGLSMIAKLEHCLFLG